MADEIIDICDEDNNLLNIQKMKSEAHKTGLWHRASHIWIYNSNGEILLQLRAKEKPLYPDMWDISAAGHISAGEDPITSGLRDVKEEIGLKIKNNEFYYVYFFKFDGNINQLKLQKEEVQKIQFLPIDKIEEELNINPEKYVPHGKYWFEVINEVKNKLKM